MKKFLAFWGLVFVTIGSARAQVEVSLDARFGFNQPFHEKSGRFCGDGLYLDINGRISPNFSYSLNQRLASTYYEDNAGFNGTNWLTLTYEINDFSVTAGKDALLVGSFEYDAYDLDSYYDMNSLFYNNFDCWQWGISGAWHPAEDHELILQIANSPFYSGNACLFSYAIGWRGAWDWYESYWTVNSWQTGSKRFMNALNLGNRFTFGDFTIDLDLMGRFYDTAGFTHIITPSYNISDWGRVFIKAGLETGDYLFGGAGFEFFPLKEDKDIRLHAIWATNSLDMNMVNIGLTWKLDLIKAVKGLRQTLDK